MEMTDGERAAYIKAAKEKQECEGVIEFDDKPKVSWSPDGDAGAYVAAWVWVSNLDLESEFNEVNTPSGEGDHVQDHLLDR